VLPTQDPTTAGPGGANLRTHELVNITESIGVTCVMETHDQEEAMPMATPQGVISIRHGITGTLGMKVAVAVRPEKIKISSQKPTVDVNLFRGVVKEISYFGSYSTYLVATDQGHTFKITEINATRLDNSDITWGDAVYFWWNDSVPVVLTQ